MGREGRLVGALRGRQRGRCKATTDEGNREGQAGASRSQVSVRSGRDSSVLVLWALALACAYYNYYLVLHFPL